MTDETALPGACQQAAQRIHEAYEAGARALSEHASREVLAAYGAPMVPAVLAADADTAAAAAEALGFPAVVKACSPELLHKSDAGLVLTGLQNASDVAAAVGQIEDALQGAAVEGFVVQPMVASKREIIVGALRDPLFGPSVMLGMGGVLVEAAADVTFRLAPLEPRDALEMMAELQAWRIFGPVRGEPAVNRGALARLLVAVGRFLVEQPEVEQVDLNPVLFDGGEPVAVDALVGLAAQPAQTQERA